MHKFTEIQFTAEEKHIGLRVDKALAEVPEIGSRSQATSLADRGFIQLNGSVIAPSHKVKLGETFLIQIPIIEKSELVPFDFKLEIIFEDDHLLVVNKPSGLVVHPAPGHHQDTLVNALLHHTQNLASGFADNRPGLVHRLDKETSGVLVVAKSDEAIRGLAKQFKKKTAHRKYFAVCYGIFKQAHGTYTSYLDRHPNDRKKFASEKMNPLEEPNGRLAITHYDVQKEHENKFSLVHLRLETGRTHQIRVHLSEAQHPIVADPIYCGSNWSKNIKINSLRQTIEATPRLLLHAAELGFTHPITLKPQFFSAPWPPEVHPTLLTLGFL